MRRLIYERVESQESAQDGMHIIIDQIRSLMISTGDSCAPRRAAPCPAWGNGRSG